MLARLDPAVRSARADLVTTVRSELFSSDGDADGNLLAADCLGRYDVVLLARVPSSRFGDTSGMPHVTGLKKLDVQYGYLQQRSDWAGLCAEVKQRIHPLLLLLFLRARDDLTWSSGTAFHTQALFQALSSNLRTEERAIIVRGIGWCDYMVVMSGENVEELVGRVEGEFVNMPVGRLRDLNAPGIGDALRPNMDRQPAFSRTYSVLGYVDSGALGRVGGRVWRPHVDLRVRPGGDSVVEAIATDACRETGVRASYYWQLGSEDGLIGFVGDDAGEVCSASEVLDWYVNKFLAYSGSPAGEKVETSDVVTTTEMRLGFKPGAALDVLPGPADISEIDPPTQFCARARANPLTQPVADCIQSITRMTNWAMANEGIHRDFADLYLHLRMLRAALETEAQQALPPGLIGRASTMARLFSEAFCQRLVGCYYDLTSDSPEVLFEYSGGIQKVLAALYAICAVVITARSRELAVDPGPAAYWVVSKEGTPAEFAYLGSAFVLRLCSSGAFSPVSGLYHVAHEMGHAVWVLTLAGKRDDSRWPPDDVENAIARGRGGWTCADEETNRLWPIQIRWIIEKDWPRGRRTQAREVGWKDLRAEVGDLVDESFADAYAFMLCGGDYSMYCERFAELLPLGEDGAELAIRWWVVTALSEVLGRAGWTQTSERRRLSQLLPVLRQRLGAAGSLNVFGLLQEARDPGNVGALIGRAFSGEAQERMSDGWREAEAQGVLDEDIARCLSLVCDYAAEAILGLDSTYWEGQDVDLAGDLGRIVVALEAVAGTGLEGIQEDWLERLWHTAMLRLGVSLAAV
jgi:hypothetical protein